MFHGGGAGSELGANVMLNVVGSNAEQDVLRFEV
jgi:hypothetical protein